MKRILLSIMASGICTAALAIPAKSGFVAYTQPDGTVINVKIVGDEHGHMLYSESGLLLMESNGRLEYAEFDSNGFPISSGIMAAPDGERKAIALNLQGEEKIRQWAEKIDAKRSSRMSAMFSNAVKATRSEEYVDDVDTEEDGRLVPLNFARTESTFPTIGQQKSLVILVE
ncbi:MAG: hypothetical protein K2M16_10965, partial [Muribaculaceae bacterium]|nr:hypothetical protein [Muribaculaceae bacterium]